MTDQKPNCSTCTNPHNKDWRKELKRYDPVRSPECGTCTNARNKCPRYNDALETTPCILHPGARAYLMKDVVKELERLSNQNVGSQYKYALTEAISLIKNGVKNDK